jgi:hypothetical protein
MCRGNSLERLKRFELALRNYLRVLVACSYCDLSGGWPRSKSPNVPVGKYSVVTPGSDPERARQLERNLDYGRYRDAIETKGTMLESVPSRPR